MPLKPKYRRIAKGVVAGALVAGLAVGISHHAIKGTRSINPFDVRQRTALVERRGPEKEIVSKRAGYINLEEQIINPELRAKQMFDDLTSLSKLEDLNLHKLKAKVLLKKYPYEIMDLFDHYIDIVANRANLDPRLFRFIFFNNSFDLENPLGIADFRTLSTILGRQISRQDLLDDPFLGMDLGAVLFSHIRKKTGIRDAPGLLTVYKFGNLPKKQFEVKRAKIARLLKKTEADYFTGFDRQKAFARAKTIMKDLIVSIERYSILTSEQFAKLSFEKQKEEIANFVEFLCGYLDLDSKFVLRLIDVESGFKYNAVNRRSGAIGLMQVRPIALKEVDVLIDGLERIIGMKIKEKELYNPYYNILVGTLIFKYYYEVIDTDYDDACKAYNMGLSDFLNHYQQSKKLQGVGRRYIGKLD